MRAAERVGGGRTRGNGFDAIFEDLAALDAVEAMGAADGYDAAPSASWSSNERFGAIDPGERALLVQLYRELIGSAEGPVLPFPVELVTGELEAPERDEPAEIVSFEALVRRRAERDAAVGETPDAQ